MKNLSFTLLFLLFCIKLGAQKEDNIWLFGYNYVANTPYSEEVRLTFGDSTALSFRQRPMSLNQSNATICDPSGNLQAYTNGCYIANKNDNYIENSEGISPGYFYNEFCQEDSSGNPIPQSAMFLPHPTDENLLYLFHVGTYFSPSLAIGYNDKLYFSIVNVSLNNGEGKVISKNNVIIQDTLDLDGFHSVRHANGRDWWLVIPKSLSNLYYIVYFSPTGVSVSEQSIGLPTNTRYGGELVFSPDGTKLARFNPRDDLRIYDFDRCQGKLSNPLYIEIIDDADNEFFGGLAFSSDGHFLYAAEIKRLLQFNMWDQSITDSKIIVAEVENTSTCSSLSKSIGYMELGPDGRIYIRPLNGQRCMHLMKRPEKEGVNCEFYQYYYSFENAAYRGMPHNPNFRLGPLDGSLCDTLGLDNLPVASWRLDYNTLDPLSVEFYDLSYYEPASWSWNFGDLESGLNNSSNERHPDHIFTMPGEYQVCLTVSNTNADNTLCRNLKLGVTHAESPEFHERIQVSPNPFVNQLNITLSKTSHSPILYLYDQMGRIIHTEHLTFGINEIDTSRLHLGLYFWKVCERGLVLRAGKLIKIND